MAFEGAIDETSFVVGPVLVSAVAGFTSPSIGLAVALVLAVVTQVGFGVHPSALPGRHSAHPASHDRGTVPFAHLGSLLLAMGAIGLVFGATQTGAAARMAGAGTEELTGPVYAAMGIGSAITGLLTTRLPRGFVLEARIAVAGVLIALAGLLAAAAHPPAALALACLLLGVALAPALIGSYALAERAAPLGWGTTTMTALATANVVGVAAGAAVAGQLVDRVSPGGALLVDGVAGVFVLAGGLAARVTRPGSG
jgi:predicted MFS family arabinose efflux permease